MRVALLFSLQLLIIFCAVAGVQSLLEMYTADFSRRDVTYCYFVAGMLLAWLVEALLPSPRGNNG